MAYEKIKLEINEDIAVLTMNTPENLNALSAASVAELSQALDEIEACGAVRVVILTGAGRAFVGGADIKYMQGLSAQQAAAFSGATNAAICRMERMGKVFIAAVNGYALGGGLELALGCDIRMFSSSAKAGLPETGLGILPGGGGTQRLPRLIGYGRACELVFTGDIISAEEAHRLGLANHVLPPEELMPAAFAMAQKIAARAPLSLARAKEALTASRNMPLDAGIQYEQNLFALCFATGDQKEGMSAFLEKRPATFRGE